MNYPLSYRTRLAGRSARALIAAGLPMLEAVVAASAAHGVHSFDVLELAIGRMS